MQHLISNDVQTAARVQGAKGRHHFAGDQMAASLVLRSTTAASTTTFLAHSLTFPAPNNQGGSLNYVGRFIDSVTYF